MPDALLERLLQSASQDNLTINIARERLRAARLMSQRSSGEFRPVLAARGAPVANPDNSASFFQAGFDATWELGLFGRSRSSQILASAETRLGDVDLRAARVVVHAEVARTYFALRGQQERMSTLEQSIALAMRLEQLFVRRQTLGLGARSQVDPVIELRLGLESARAHADEMLSRHAEALALLLGRSEPDADWMRPSDAPQLAVVAESLLEASPADVLRRRPDMLRAELEVQRAAARLGLAQSDLYPSVSIVGSLSAAFRGTGHLRRAPGSLLSIGPTIDIPLFDWGMRRAARDARGAELQAASLAYREAVLESLSDAESALATLRATQLQLRNQQQQYGLRAAAALAIEASQHRQMASDIDLIGARLAVLEAGRQLSEARESQSEAYIALSKALGDDAAPATSGAG